MGAGSGVGSKPRCPGEQTMKTLRRSIERHRFLEIIDDASSATSFAVSDRRQILCLSVGNATQLRDLVKHGAEWYLESEHNLGPRPALVFGYGPACSRSSQLSRWADRSPYGGIRCRFARLTETGIG
jgi:hypothetical protein